MAQEKPFRHGERPIKREGVGPHSKLMPEFKPPPLPLCADGSVPEHKAKAERHNKYRRWKLRNEELQDLDFHGLGGTVPGLRAYLAHRFCGSVRGWRVAVAPDELGLKPVTFQEFNIAMKKIGFASNIMTLWRELSKPACTTAGLGPSGRTASLEDLEPDLVKHLDAVSKGLFEKYKEGGAFAWWLDVPREHAGRITFKEFENFIQDNELVSREARRKGWFIDLRRVFEAMDIKQRCTLTRDDLRFLDHWATRRFGRALPEEDVREYVEPEPWSPPPKALEPLHGLEEFREFLTRNFGVPARAWRMMLDVKGDGVLQPSDFGKGCRAAGWHYPHHPLFLELKQAGRGAVNLRALDPETAEAIDELNAAVFPRFGDIFTFWQELLDPGQCGVVSLTEFVADVRHELNIASDRLTRVFQTLDTANTGWVAVTEVGFLEAFEGGQMAIHSSQGSQSQPNLRLPNLHGAGAGMFGTTGGFRRGSRSGGMAGMPLSPGLPRSISWSDGGASHMQHGSTFSGEFRRSVGDATTRASSRTAFSQSYMMKNRWLRKSAMERITHCSKGVTKTRLPKKTGQGDIFRYTNEFYREGVQMLQESYLQSGASQSMNVGNDED